MPTATPAFTQSNKLALTAYTTASTTATHVTGDTSGSKVMSLNAASDSTSAHIFLIKLSTGGTAVTLGAVSIPASAGTDGATPSVNMLSATLIPGLPVDSNGNPFLYLPSTSHILTLTASASINTGKTVNFSSVHESF